MRKILVSLVIIFFYAVSPTFSDEVIYRPGPFQGKDVWFGSFYNQAGVNDSKLNAGGWGDEYRFLIQFDTEGLPKNVTAANLWMLPFTPPDTATPVSLYAYLVASTWEETSVTWANQPSLSYAGQIPAPTPGTWYGINITSIYQQWKNSPNSNFGLGFRPTSTNNRSSLFFSSDYTNSIGFRPYLQLIYSPTITPLSLKMPLPGNKGWMVTTEIGGRDCATPGSLPPSHTGANYFSIDFGRTSLQNGTTTVESDVPVYAAAGGKVIFAGPGTGQQSQNGNYVVIDHDGDGNVNTGYSTRYLHLKDNTLAVTQGQTVYQGDMIGTMGGSGGWPVHLHFGVQYRGSSLSSVEELTWVKMEGKSLKSYMTECNSSGSRILYYYSTNTP